VTLRISLRRTRHGQGGRQRAEGRGARGVPVALLCAPAGQRPVLLQVLQADLRPCPAGERALERRWPRGRVVMALRVVDSCKDGADREVAAQRGVEGARGERLPIECLRRPGALLSRRCRTEGAVGARCRSPPLRARSGNGAVRGSSRDTRSKGRAAAASARGGRSGFAARSKSGAALVRFGRPGTRTEDGGRSCLEKVVYRTLRDPRANAGLRRLHLGLLRREVLNRLHRRRRPV
jgi:hypothetical protein